VLVLCLALASILFTSSCSEVGSTKQIRATVFLLDASKSTIASVSAREAQLRERLAAVFDNQEAIYFDFIRKDYTKQRITPLISMQTIISVEDVVLKDALDEKVRKETKELVSKVWAQAMSDTITPEACSSDTTQLLNESVLSETGARTISRNLCISAAKAKKALSDIRAIGLGQSLENAYIGSDIEGAFLRGLNLLESESQNLLNAENLPVAVKAEIVISSDMMQRGSTGINVIDTIKKMTQDEVTEFVIKSRGDQEPRTLRPKVIIDGWLSTTRNFTENERKLLENYWNTWFNTLELNEPDFGFGIIDWSVR
jgi:hypothetical protein